MLSTDQTEQSDSNPLQYINQLHEGFSSLLERIQQITEKNKTLETKNSLLKQSIVEEKMQHNQAVIRFDKEINEIREKQSSQILPDQVQNTNDKRVLKDIELKKYMLQKLRENKKVVSKQIKEIKQHKAKLGTLKGKQQEVIDRLSKKRQFYKQNTEVQEKKQKNQKKRKKQCCEKKEVLFEEVAHLRVQMKEFILQSESVKQILNQKSNIHKKLISRRNNGNKILQSLEKECDKINNKFKSKAKRLNTLVTLMQRLENNRKRSNELQILIKEHAKGNKDLKQQNIYKRKQIKLLMLKMNQKPSKAKKVRKPIKSEKSQESSPKTRYSRVKKGYKQKQSPSQFQPKPSISPVQKMQKREMVSPKRSPKQQQFLNSHKVKVSPSKQTEKIKRLKKSYNNLLNKMQSQYKEENIHKGSPVSPVTKQPHEITNQFHQKKRQLSPFKNNDLSKKMYQQIDLLISNKLEHGKLIDDDEDNIFHLQPT